MAEEVQKKTRRSRAEMREYREQQERAKAEKAAESMIEREADGLPVARKLNPVDAIAELLTSGVTCNTFLEIQEHMQACVELKLKYRISDAKFNALLKRYTDDYHERHGTKA